MKKIWLIIIVLLLVACESKESFELYLVPFEEAGYITSVEDLELPEQPLLTSDDMISYDWQNHEVVLKASYLKSLNPPNLEEVLMIKGGSERFGTIQRDYFVVVVNGEKIYYGNFRYAMVSSYLNPSAELIDTEDGFIIQLSSLGQEVRNDERVYHTLKKLELLIE